MWLLTVILVSTTPLKDPQPRGQLSAAYMYKEQCVNDKERIEKHWNSDSYRVVVNCTFAGYLAR